MSTYVETAETKIIFKLQSEQGTGTAFTDRTLTLPGQPDTDARAAWLQKCKEFRAAVLAGTPIQYGPKADLLIQPVNWRDSSGAGASMPTVDPYKTIDVEFELYTVQRQRFTAEDFNS